jgi:peptidoglycan/LPS O-acetylase OafA/YrhL
MLGSVTRRIAVIDGLRGIAILGVIYHHMVGAIRTPPGFVTWNMAGFSLYPLTFLTNSQQGVSLFFVLSGFVLFLPYARGERTIASARDIPLFWWHRTKRLLPLLIVSGIGAVAIREGWNPEKIFAGTKHLLTDVLTPFTDGKASMFFPRYNWVLWSLRVEIWFSIIFPLLVPLVIRRHPVMVTVTTVILSASYRIYAEHHWDYPGDILVDNILGRLDQFILGMLAAAIHTQKKEATKPWHAAIGLLFLFVSFSIADWRAITESSLHTYTIRTTLMNAGMTLIVLGAVGKPSIVTALLGVGILRMLGIMTYSLYVWHGVFFEMLRGNGTVYEQAVYGTTVFIISGLTYMFIERGGIVRIAGKAEQRTIRDGVMLPFSGKA